MANANQVAVQAITKAAQQYGIDPQAMIAVSQVESGLNPRAIGDGGHAFGLFQFNNAGGVITGDPNPSKYLDPSYNALQAARHIATIKGIKGARGADAIKLIVNNFERPADKTSEINKALSYYQGLNGAPTPTIASKGTQTASNGFTLQNGVSTQANKPNALGTLLDYAMKGSSPSEDGGSSTGDILNVLTQGGDIPAPTVFSPASTTAPGAPPATTTAGASADAGGKVTTISNPKIIGTPYHGTHTLGNWESDNAVDIAMPKGTPIYATEDGTIGSQIGALGSSNPRMAGLRVHLDGSDNNFYYAHLSKLAVKAGEKVKAGDLIGYSGEANGVAHLHLATQKGNPGKYA